MKPCIRVKISTSSYGAQGQKRQEGGKLGTDSGERVHPVRLEQSRNNEDKENHVAQTLRILL